MPYEVWSQDYQAELLAEACALLTYRTAHVGEQGRLERHANRALIRQLTDGRWRLRFHQGTPAQAFDPRRAEQRRQFAPAPLPRRPNPVRRGLANIVTVQPASGMGLRLGAQGWS